MWPTPLSMTRDDCRRTLRRLELEAYSNMMSVFRAQGALEDNRKKILEELRAVLHIGNDRHSAEARRVANDEYLATIAEQLCGPNTGLGWTSEGRRTIPLMPRGIAQTAFTDIADKAALSALIENEQIIQKNNDIEKDALIAPKSTPEESSQDVEMADYPATGEDGFTSDDPCEYYSAPVVMADQSAKFLDAERETPSRKRVRAESGILPDDTSTMTLAPPSRNTSRAKNQKHLNISQIYSNYSKNPSGKTPGQSKHSYNQVNKSNNKAHTSRTSTKHRGHKHSSNKPPPQIVLSKSQMKNSVNITTESNVSFPSNVMQYQKDLNASIPTSGFQANFAQSIRKSAKNYVNIYGDELKINSQTGLVNVVSDCSNQQLMQEYSLHEDAYAIHAKPHAPSTAKPSHLIIKKKGEMVPETASTPTQVSNIQFIQKPTEGIKVIHNRKLTAAGNAAPVIQTGKLITTKLVQQIAPKSQKQLSANLLCQPDINYHSVEKTIAMTSSQPVSVASTIQKGIINSKNIMNLNSSATVTMSQPNLDASLSSKVGEDARTPKNIVSDVKPLSTKTFVLNSKSGQKMVVLPGKARTKTPILGQSLPLLQVKGIAGRPQMKFVPMSNPPVVKSTSNITIVSKPTITNMSRPTLPTVSSYDGTKKIHISNTIIPSQAIMRPASTKGNVIVLQKGTSISKAALTFAKNANEVSKLMLSNKNVGQLNIHSPVTFKNETPEQIPTTEPGKGPGNVIVLELNNEKLRQGTTISDILEENAMNSFVTNNTSMEKIGLTSTEGQNTPILLDNQLSDEASNANSMDSLCDNIMSTSKHVIHDKHKSPSVADWEKCDQNINKSINALQLDLGMSSDSETDAYLLKNEKSDTKPFDGELVGQPDIDCRLHVQRNELYAGRGRITHPTHTLLSELQDEGSSSNDSSFLLTKTNNTKRTQAKVRDGAHMETKTQHQIKHSATSHRPDKTKVSEERANIKINQKQTDIFGSAIASNDINLDTFEYLEDGMMSAEEMFQLSGEGGGGDNKIVSRDGQLSHLLQTNPSGDPAQNITDKILFKQ